VLAIRARKSPSIIVARIEVQTLRGAELSGVSLSHACLVGFDLREARLRNASLRNADLSEANLCGADLSGADLRGAALRGALFDASTCWPAAFDPEPTGAVRCEAAVAWTPGAAEKHALFRAERLRAQSSRCRAREECQRAQQLKALCVELTLTYRVLSG
jgi:hypothetical protein